MVTHKNHRFGALRAVNPIDCHASILRQPLGPVDGEAETLPASAFVFSGGLQHGHRAHATSSEVDLESVFWH
jgi:hypothetical protein